MKKFTRKTQVKLKSINVILQATLRVSHGLCKKMIQINISLLVNNTFYEHKQWYTIQYSNLYV